MIYLGGDEEAREEAAHVLGGLDLAGHEEPGVHAPHLLAGTEEVPQGVVGYLLLFQ
jgi:hypothetical protein